MIEFARGASRPTVRKLLYAAHSDLKLATPRPPLTPCSTYM